MHNFSTAIAGIALLTALGALVYAISARRYAHACYEFVELSNTKSLTLQQLTKIETELTEHDDSIKSILKSMHKLRSRIHARSLNESKKESDDGPPDPKEDPEGWKRHVNAQLAHGMRKEK